jgi:hypothetical protein
VSDYENWGNTPADLYDQTRWQEVDTETLACSGETKYPMGGTRFICPLSPRPTKLELDTKCCCQCIAAKSNHCAGFNGQGPTPRKGAKIIWR